MGLMTKIEHAIAKPFEFIHTRKGFQPVDICRLSLKCLEQGARKGIKRTYAPNRINVWLSEKDYTEYTPFFSVICSDIKGELRRVIDERDYLLAGELSVKILMDKTLDAGLPRVEGFMQGDCEPSSVISVSEKEELEPAALDAGDDILDEKTVIMLPYTAAAEERQVSIVRNVMGMCAFEMPGATLIWGADGLYLENKEKNERVTINGAVYLEKILKDGDEIDIHGLKFTYTAKQSECA